MAPLALSALLAVLVAMPAATDTPMNGVQGTAQRVVEVKPSRDSFGSPSRPGGPQKPAQQVRVVDGDTIHIDGRKIRLFGIDAPETRERCGPQATAALSELLRGRSDRLRCEVRGRPSHGRSVELCRVDGTDLGELMVLNGWAWDAPKFSRGHYAGAEADARANRRGIWGGGNCR